MNFGVMKVEDYNTHWLDDRVKQNKYSKFSPQLWINSHSNYSAVHMYLDSGTISVFWLCTPDWIWNGIMNMRLKCRLPPGYLCPYLVSQVY